MKKVVILIFILSSAVLCQQGDSLTGVWQDVESVGAGWSNTFLFFSDGTFKFFFSQMDQRKREIGFSGRYKVDGDGLYLEITRMKTLEGGRLVEDPMGRQGDSILVNAAPKTLTYDPPKEGDMSISKVYADTEFAMGKYIYLDAIKFYLMSKNPSELLHEFEGK